MYLFITGAEILLHLEQHLNSLQHNILKNVRVTSVKRIYPEKLTQFQQHHSIHHSRVFHEWQSPQAHVQITNWSPPVPGITP